MLSRCVRLPKIITIKEARKQWPHYHWDEKEEENEGEDLYGETVKYNLRRLIRTFLYSHEEDLLTCFIDSSFRYI